MAYDTAFARIYDERWSSFARSVAPRIQQAYESLGLEERTLLDLACGTGQLAAHFADQGYTVIGLDLSPAMLEFAQRNAPDATFIQGDMTAFTLEQPVGLVVSTFDALNHLPDLGALGRCFAAVDAALLSGGLFVFDLNTAHGLAERWPGLTVTPGSEVTLIQRGIFDGVRAATQITGFVRAEDGRYDRFDEVMHNTAFALNDVAAALNAAGFTAVGFSEDLQMPTPEPERLGRVWVTGRKP